MNIGYERKEPLNGEDIAKEIGSTRQYVCNTLKSGLSKMYYGLSKKCPDLTPFEIVEALRAFFGCETKKEIEKFYNAFPPKIREKVQKSLEIEAQKEKKTFF